MDGHGVHGNLQHQFPLFGTNTTIQHLFMVRHAIGGVSVKNASPNCKKSSSNHPSGQIALKFYILVLEMILNDIKMKNR